MSLPGVDDLIFGDLLAEFKLKPWWEKFRGYCIAASIATTFSIIYFLDFSSNVYCLPYINGTSEKTLSTPRNDFIDSFCRGLLPWNIRYAGMVALVSCVSIICISALWLYHPNVVNALLTFAKSEEILAQHQLSVEELKALSTAQQNNRNNRDVQLAVRRACSLLWMYKMEKNFGIAAIYWVRNVALVVISLAMVVYSCVISHELAVTRQVFDCVAFEVSELTGSYYQNYFCLHSTGERILPYYIIFTGAILLQAVLAALGMWKTRQCFNPVVGGTRRWKEAVNFLNFMSTFWINSRPVGSGLFLQLCHFLAEESLDVVKTRIKQEEIKDLFLIKLYTTLHVSKGEEVGDAILSAIKAKSFEDDFSEGKRGKQEEMVRIILNIEALIWHDRLTLLLDYLIELKRWEVLVAVLDIEIRNSRSERDDHFMRYLETKSLNLDELGAPVREQKSLLYYALSKGLDGKYRMTAAKRILHRSEDGRTKYVHYEGVSKNATEFVTSNTINSDAESEMLLKMILESENINLGEPVPSASQSEISRIYQEVSACDHWPRELNGEISRYKFTHWDEDAKNLAKLANERLWWRQFVELLNSFIVEGDNTSDELNVLNCGVTEFDVSSEAQGRIKNGASLLYFAFLKCENHSNYVVTAARHILACTRGQEKKLHTSGYWTEGLYFVKELSRLQDHEIKVLTSLIKRSNRPPTPQEQREPSVDVAGPRAVSVAVSSRTSDSDMLTAVASPKETEQLLKSTSDIV